jgi:hypothetical protein
MGVEVSAEPQLDPDECRHAECWSGDEAWCDICGADMATIDEWDGG